MYPLLTHAASHLLTGLDKKGAHMTAHKAGTRPSIHVTAYSYALSASGDSAPSTQRLWSPPRMVINSTLAPDAFRALDVRNDSSYGTTSSLSPCIKRHGDNVSGSVSDPLSKYSCG
jgi:hypothetical protein